VKLAEAGRFLVKKSGFSREEATEKLKRIISMEREASTKGLVVTRGKKYLGVELLEPQGLALGGLFFICGKEGLNEFLQNSDYSGEFLSVVRKEYDENCDDCLVVIVGGEQGNTVNMFELPEWFVEYYRKFVDLLWNGGTGLDLSGYPVFASILYYLVHNVGDFREAVFALGLLSLTVDKMLREERGKLIPLKGSEKMGWNEAN